MDCTLLVSPAVLRFGGIPLGEGGVVDCDFRGRWMTAMAAQLLAIVGPGPPVDHGGVPGCAVRGQRLLDKVSHGGLCKALGFF